MTMDYKYIEQLLDRYFECETTLEEEQILRTFFAQKDVPVRLLSYRQLFTEPLEAKEEEQLGSDFDERIMSLIDDEQSRKEVVMEPLHVKARIIPIHRRLRPFYKAAACVAVVLALGQAAQMPYSEQEKAQRESIARSLQKPQIQKDANAVAKGDSAATPSHKMQTSVAN